MFISNCDGCLLNFLLVVNSRSGTQCKRAFKRAEEVRPCDVSGHAEEMEKNQKILLWLMEGQKEMVQRKRSPYGSVINDFTQLLYKGLAFLEEMHVTGQRSYYVEKWQSCGSLAQTLKITLHLICMCCDASWESLTSNFNSLSIKLIRVSGCHSYLGWL